ncbi:YihY/virulence factor BrkB family protein [Alteraurantiacibacter aquimixticola]|uniref:YihY/virulence factor BrkB family protein n=1 Tax=Alteraurantiacibacter aquimixticola TaxID=2489173 RepID=A0A4T3F016_9SPHN|nr:YihY/virulence factor BrkB family protein [Alteraurantiacibacter aquimixticola]TIX49194.1 YihY/virulence factor BrkB family protein [Alteraurantiacibacter aquimixticola]
MAPPGMNEAPPPGTLRTDLSPEARRRQGIAYYRKYLDRDRAWEVVKRVVIGCYNDGLIHAGNLAYMSMLAIFPFFITAAAILGAVTDDQDQAAIVATVLAAMPPIVANVIEPVAMNVIDARSGWLLWVGALFGLWTVGSLIETIRDILRRAYGTEATRAFWQYRLFSTGIIIAAVMLLILSLFAQVAIGTAQQVIEAYFPQFNSWLNELSLSRIIPGIGLFGSLYLLFYTLTPARYRRSRYPKWPGALLVTGWWIGVTVVMPRVLRLMFAYDLTYGSLAGIMIALFFFWLVGLGMVAGAELNAALAEPVDAEADGSDHKTDKATQLEETS